MRPSLSGPRNPNRIRQYLRPEIQSARKNGGSGRIKADTGVVYLPTTDAREDQQKGMDAIGEISRLAIGAVSPESLIAPE